MGDFYHPLYLRDDRYKHAKACEIMEETCDINDMDDVKNGNGGDDAKDVKKLEASKQLTLPGDTGVNTGSITPRMLMGKSLSLLYTTWVEKEAVSPVNTLFVGLFYKIPTKNRQISRRRFHTMLSCHHSQRKEKTRSSYRYDRKLYTWKHGIDSETGPSYWPCFTDQ